MQIGFYHSIIFRNFAPHLQLFKILQHEKMAGGRFG